MKDSKHHFNIHSYTHKKVGGVSRGQKRKLNKKRMSFKERFVNPDEPEAWKLTEHKSMLKWHAGN